jgi:hypothetical protein
MLASVMRSRSVCAVPSAPIVTASAIHGDWGIVSSSDSPSLQTAAVSQTTVAMRSGIASATRGVTTPPMLCPTRMTSRRSSNSTTFTTSVTNVSKSGAGRCQRSPNPVSVGA